MKQSAAKRARAKLLRRPVQVEVMGMIHPQTGEVVGALVPVNEIDRKSMRERKFRIGTRLLAELRLDRNPGFWRKAHVLGGWLAANVDDFHGLSHHDALKRLQETSRIGVTTEEIDIDEPQFTGRITRTIAESLNFSDMDEGRWNELWGGADGEGGWIGWLRSNVFGGLDAISREEVEDLLEKPQ